MAHFMTARSRLPQVVASLALLLWLTACDQDPFSAKKYEIREARGEVYLLNQVTGKVFLRDRDRLVELKQYDEEKLTSLAKAQKLLALPVKGLEFDVWTKFRSDGLVYRITITGEPKPSTKADDKSVELVDPDWQSYWKETANRLNFNFLDSDGFVVATKIVTIGGPYGDPHTSIVNDKDQIFEYEYDGEVGVDVPSYEAIRSVDVTYALSKPKPDAK